ncbi:MAG: hypothetical protein K2X91_13815 [Thermoleophilia bacterium]|nr:hypothetical protein [Thermoleophilia bacterium]
MNPFLRTSVPLLAALLAGCASDPEPQAISPGEPATSTQADSITAAIDQRTSAAAAFLRRPSSSTVAHPDDPDHCRMVLALARALAGDARRPVEIDPRDAAALTAADPATAEREFLARVAVAQRELIRARTMAGAGTAEDQAALKAIQSLVPVIAVPLNASAGSAPKAPTTVGPKPATPDAASAERNRAVEDYLKRRGFKQHPTYTPSN